MLGEFLSELSRRGVSVWVDGERIAVRPAERLTEADREVLRRDRAALVAYLSQPRPETWNRATALHLMDQVDAAVEHSGAKGTHHEIQAAVELVCTAYAAKDMPCLRAACKAMTATIRRLSGS
jgi:hypothetical protein